jgi:hypothetical protein
MPDRSAQFEFRDLLGMDVGEPWMDSYYRGYALRHQQRQGFFFALKSS